MKSSMQHLGLALCLGLSGFSGVAVAADDSVMIDGRMPEVAELEEWFVPKSTIGTINECRTVKKENSRCGGVIPSKPVATTMVQFDVGSAVLTMESKGFLDRVATALKNKKDYVDNVTVVGHTDATGSRVKNKILSKQRAESVRQYLANVHNITNVQTDGVGSEQLKDPSNPKAGVNRRIEFAVAAGIVQATSATCVTCTIQVWLVHGGFCVG